MSWKGPETPGLGLDGGRFRIGAALGPNRCGASKQRLEEIMKRTRKSEAAEAKVRAPQRAALGVGVGEEEAGEEHSGWRKEAEAGCSGSRLGEGRIQHLSQAGSDTPESDCSSSSQQKLERKEANTNSSSPGKGPVPLCPFPHPIIISPSHQPAADGLSFPVIDTVRAEDSRPSELQKDAVQKEELAPQEPQWRYSSPSRGPGRQSGAGWSWGSAWAVLGCELPECVPASAACLTRSPW